MAHMQPTSPLLPCIWLLGQVKEIKTLVGCMMSEQASINQQRKKKNTDNFEGVG